MNNNILISPTDITFSHIFFLFFDNHNILTLNFTIYWLVQLWVVNEKWWVSKNGHGLCPVEIFTEHVQIRTRVHHPTCPVETSTGHKPHPTKITHHSWSHDTLIRCVIGFVSQIILLRLQYTLIISLKVSHHWKCFLTLHNLLNLNN